MSRRRVVITGLGAVCSLGNDAPTAWEAAKAGRSGARRVTRFDPSNISCQIACEVRDFDGAAYLGRESKKLDLFSQYGVVAADEAIQSSGLDFAAEDSYRCGVITGSGIGGLIEVETQHGLLRDKGPRRVSPFFIPRLMVNALSGHISIRHGLRGPNYVTASACASSSHAIGLAFHAIRSGTCDVMVTGGSEATITELAMAGFSNMKAMSKRNEEPERASLLIFEELEHAKARGAVILAEVKGFGMTADAHHITAPTPEGEGPAEAMRLAMQDGQVDCERVSYVNAHGTSTPLNDAAETLAIRTVFGEHADRLCVSSSKSMVGHLLGGSGGLESVLTILMIKDGVINPTINQETPDPACNLDYVPNESREAPIDHALSNSLGFGGHNVSLLFARLDG
ncbi:MAG: beta-ketoacyl-[acyl-carrier-protein] synthase II [Planctomycetota bacterium]|jgi:3-oxoacyl-[acyl-carrier-protein] synthase II